MTARTIIGTISGTSADGIDIAEITSDGRAIASRRALPVANYQPETRAAVLQAVAEGGTDRDAWPALSEAITRDHLAALKTVTETNRPDVIVFHGQTVWHDPKAGETVQLGDPQLLANELGIPVVGDVRLADMAEGGEGAPMVPVYHQALAGDLPKPLCFLNIGGVSNLTFVTGDELIAFDIGPGNALLDDWIRQHSAGEYDQDGRISAAGSIDETRVDQALAHPYFDMPGPKSLDRNAFSLTTFARLSLEDGAASLAAFTAEAVARSVSLLPEEPKLWIVCGGGRKNPTIMRELSERLSGKVSSSDDYGIDGDSLEAEAMAFLGARFLEGLPTSFPGTTGAARPVVGGRLYEPGG